VLNEPVGTSTWERIHARQAATLGVAATLAYLVVLALPFLVVIAVPAISTGWIVAIYGVGMAADLAAAIWWCGIVLHYSARANRGELFAIPIVSPIVDRIFHTSAGTPNRRAR
jgi:uncharacterized membrane protein